MGCTQPARPACCWWTPSPGPKSGPNSPGTHGARQTAARPGHGPRERQLPESRRFPARDPDRFNHSTVAPPIGEASVAAGLHESLHGREGKEAPIPDDMRDEVEAARLAMIEAAAETDDELVMKYLEGEELDRRGASMACTRALNRTITPVYCGSAIADINPDRLLHACCATYRRQVSEPSRQ